MNKQAAKVIDRFSRTFGLRRSTVARLWEERPAWERAGLLEKMDREVERARAERDNADASAVMVAGSPTKETPDAVNEQRSGPASG